MVLFDPVSITREIEATPYAHARNVIIAYPHREDWKKLYKPQPAADAGLRAGTPGDSGVLVVTRVRSTTTKCTRGRGCNGHLAFPTPSKGER
jgi:hypothetical protein